MFDAFVGLMVDERTIDQKIYDALARHIKLSGLTLEVKQPSDPLIPPNHIRHVHLTDGHTHAVLQFSVDEYEYMPEEYTAHIAHRLVMFFAEERYLRKR